MKKHLLLLLLAVSPVITFASKGLLKQTGGPATKVSREHRQMLFANAIKVGKSYYAIGNKLDVGWMGYGVSGTMGLIIYRLDERMNVQGVNFVPAMLKNKSVLSYKLVQFGDELCALLYFNNRKTLRQYLFAQVIDKKTLKPEGTVFKIAEAPISKREKRIGCLFTVNLTQDKSKLVVTFDRSKVWASKRQKKAAAGQKNHTFTYWLIDKDFQLINSGKNVKFGKGNTRLLAQTFDSSGNLCLLGLESSSSVKKKKIGDDDDEDGGKSRLVMKIVRIDGSETELEFAKGESFYSADMKINPKTGNVAVVGLLASGRYGARGIFTQQVNIMSGEVLAESRQLFNVEFVKEINSVIPTDTKKKNKGKDSEAKEENPKKSKKKAKKEEKKRKKDSNPPEFVYNLVNLAGIHYNENNELIVLTQKHYTYTVTYTTTDSKGNRYTRTVTYYVYGDVIGFKLDSMGNVENFGYMFHHSEYLGPMYRDFNSLYTGQKLFIVMGFSACHMEMNNRASKIEYFKDQYVLNSRRSYISTLNVEDRENEVIQVQRTKRQIAFLLRSVNIDNQ